MKFYKDSANTVFAYEDDGSQDSIIPADQVPITQAEADALRFPPLPPVIPAEVTMRQAQLAMLAFTYPDGSNLLDKVNALVAQQPRAAQITWNASSAVKRSNALVAALQPALGLTDAQVDQLFVTAATFTE